MSAIEVLSLNLGRDGSHSNLCSSCPVQGPLCFNLRPEFLTCGSGLVTLSSKIFPLVMKLLLLKLEHALLLENGVDQSAKGKTTK